jgi:hypothetical protein
MKNKYRIDGEYAFISLQSGKYETKISLCDLEKANSFPGAWFADYEKHTNGHYVHGKLPVGGGKYKTVCLHRWIFGIDDAKIQIDHINHKTLENTRENMSVVSQYENRQNLSNIKGYCLNRNEGKYVGYISVYKRHIHLGYFDTEAEASIAYKIAKLKYHEYYASVS